MNVSAIICVYNEEETIEDVIKSVSKSEMIDEIIVINDGSTDSTKKIINKIREDIDIKDIHFKENKGKGYAMAIGVENAVNEIVVFIDADLSNLQEDHFAQLITPIFKNEADMVLGQASETLINYSINPFKSLTGERALLKQDVLPVIEKIKHSRFGVETLINLHFQSQGKKIKYVMLEGLKHPTKFEKVSKQQAVKEFIKEGHQIALTAYKNFDLITKSVKNSISNNFNI